MNIECRNPEGDVRTMFYWNVSVLLDYNCIDSFK